MAALSSAMAAFASTVVSPLSRRLNLGSSSFSGTSVSSSPTSSQPLGYSVGDPLRIVADKNLVGKVVRTVNDKTAAVEVTRIAPHPRYRKRVRLTKTYQVHDPENQCVVGDVVQLAKCRPVSKLKSFVLVEIKQRKAKLQIPARSKTADLAAGAAPAAPA